MLVNKNTRMFKEEERACCWWEGTREVKNFERDANADQHGQHDHIDQR